MADTEATGPVRSQRATQAFTTTEIPADISTGSDPRPHIPEVSLDAELGRGGMGVVYRGRQTYLDRAVAVKVLKPGVGGAEFTARFRREATLLAGLAHPHIVACHHAGALADGSCFLVMEFIDGPNLWHHIRAHGALSPLAVVQIIRDIASALRYAQVKGIIHRDVKPENILLAPGGPAGPPADFPFIAKLVDLGLARPVAAIGAAGLTQQGVILGTPSTMAPEQFDDPEAVDHRADMYGLGCVGFQALTGEPAFRGTSLIEIVSAKASDVVPDPSAMRPSCPKGITAIIRRLLARRREDRYATYDALIIACETELGVAPTVAMASTPRPPAVGHVGLVAGMAVLVVLAVGGWFAWRPGQAGPPEAAAPRGVTPLATVVTPETPSPTSPTSPTSPNSLTQPALPELAPPVADVPLARTASPDPIARWSPWGPLHGDEPSTGLADWEAAAGWGLAEENPGLVGFSRERTVLRRSLPAQAWRVRGRFGPVGAADYQEAGILITCADSSSIQAVVRNLGPTRFLAVERLGADGKPSERLHFGALDQPPPWDFVVTRNASELTWTVGEREGSVVLTTEPVSLGLVVAGGAVAVQELALSTPARK